MELQDDTENTHNTARNYKMTQKNTTKSPLGALSTAKLIYENLRRNLEKLGTQSDLEKNL